MSTFSSSKSATRVVSLGRPPRVDGAAVNPPIAMSSTFVGSGYVTAENRVYARFSNAAWEPLEDAIGQLEGSPTAGLAYASGLAAVSAVFDLVPGGGVLVIPTASYNGTIALARALSADGKLQLREADPIDTEATIAAMDGADLFWIESPSNPLLEIAELPTLIAAAHDRGLLVAVDNTFSTPLRQQPLRVGADVVVHSATKFIAGHSDVILGLTVTKDPELRKTLHARRSLRGGIPGQFEAWLTLRGLRTLALRLDRSEESAGILARRLLGHEDITRVRYPGLPSDPNHQRAKDQLSGFGAIISIELEGGPQRADRFVEALELIVPATSLGGVESLAERRRRHPSEPDRVPESLVRLSIGIEDVDDVWEDIAQALEASQAR
ncbi:PLP-dependent aspartate aminotransferase family protein [Schaalia sp. JY-X169]|uniref:trans-sulfuration enzyme family protein n=1 Tax=Schaalia sp. JY-X169 TaxID=2758572 RepID=UPI0015F78284|nr:aminotransferase class I/II-fold pyridoxal phosphate-dependent enzyme [Schaalia sp. JY-X169]